MRILDYNRPVGSRSLRYAEPTVGIVFKTPDETSLDNVISVYIPRLMFGISPGTGAMDETVSFGTSKIGNTGKKSFGKTSFESGNYINLQVASAYDHNTPKFAMGENVFISIVDSDLKNMYVLPYTLGETNRRKNDIWSVLVPNFKKHDEAPLTYDNTFGFQIDTRNKLISFWTSESECKDEKGVYYIGMNAKEGKILISDSGKRTITMSTDDDSISIVNEAESVIEMVKDVVNITTHKTINIKADNDINVECKKLNRDCDNIKTTSKEDVEETDKLEIKGNEWSANYNKTTFQSTTFENTTTKWVTNSPISGFSAILTSASFSISPTAGSPPLPIAPNVSAAGIMTSGLPSMISMSLTKAQPLISVLMQIAAKVDCIAGCVGVPPTSVSAVSAALPLLPSMSVMG